MDAAIFGAAGGVAFPGVAVVVAGLHRWLARAPFMVRNGLAWREEALAGVLDDDRRAWLNAERELYAAALAGVLPQPSAFAPEAPQ